MLLRQYLVTCCCIVINLERISAVINNAPTSSEDPLLTNITKLSTTNETNDNNLSDSVAESTDLEALRKESSLWLTNPTFLQNTYLPSATGNLGLPAPVYGVPAVGTPNIVYPSPPPDIPPPISSPYLGPHKPAFPFPSVKYGPPRHFKPFGIPKPLYGHPKFQYGPPSNHLFNPHFKTSKPFYNPPKSIFVPEKPFPTYGVPLSIPKDFYNANNAIYGAPNLKPELPQPQYGPPEPIYHGPPHPGIPAPPTPPDIKYDGWQPIIGLVSKLPAGAHEQQQHNFHNNDYSADLAPPSLSHTSGFKGDSYSAPLNTVTGSGGVVSTSGEDHAQLSAAANHNLNQNEPSLVKSIEYEILSHTNKETGQNSYITPLLNSYPTTGPYAAAHSYAALHQPIDTFATSLGSSFESSLFGSNVQTGVPLIPPSGVYGVPPNGKYGTPLLQPPLTKNPILFKDTGALGLLNSVIPKDNHGVLENVLLNDFGGTPYVPPPIQNVNHLTKVPLTLPSLYSLPSKNAINNFNGFGNSNGNFKSLQFNSLANYPAAISTNYGVPQTQFRSAQSGFYTPPHDCAQNLQAINPTSFAVPSTISYTTLSNAIAPPPVLNQGLDLNTAYSQTSSTIAENSVESREKFVGKAVQNSQAIDLNNIPLEGALGSYTLQIQSSDNNAGISGVPHEQLLKDGLLQSILGAIEQPQAKTADILKQPLLHLQQVPQPSSVDYDAVAKDSITQSVVVPFPTQNRSKPNNLEEPSNSDRQKKLLLIDNNEIALYFTNTNDKATSEQEDKTANSEQPKNEGKV